MALRSCSALFMLLPLILIIIMQICPLAWWRHQMETFSALLAICAGNSPVPAVPGEFPAQRPVTRSFNVFFDLHPNKRLSNQWWGWWFETLSCPFWRHRNGIEHIRIKYSRGKCKCLLFGNGNVISSHALWQISLLTYPGLKVKPC